MFFFKSNLVFLKVVDYKIWPESDGLNLLSPRHGHRPYCRGSGGTIGGRQAVWHVLGRVRRPADEILRRAQPVDGMVHPAGYRANSRAVLVRGDSIEAAHLHPATKLGAGVHAALVPCREVVAQHATKHRHQPATPRDPRQATTDTTISRRRRRPIHFTTHRRLRPFHFTTRRSPFARQPPSMSPPNAPAP